jgi:ATP-dependent RNA helicase RhlE
MTEFTDFPLAKSILRAIAEEGYTTPTPIQEKSIPPLMEGHDLLGVAQTGTGKTAAFALPLLNRLGREAGKPDHRRPRGLILAPTRELAGQIHDSLRTYGRYLGLRTGVVFGGVSIRPQIKMMSQGVHVLVATPGRLLDLMEQDHIRLENVEVFVLDEADRMLDMGFIPDVRKIVSKLSMKRQTLMFSATMPGPVATLAATMLKDPIQVEVTPTATTVEKIEQRVLFVTKDKKRDLLVDLMNDDRIERVLVFTRTKHGADRVAKQLQKNGIEADAIHGNKAQNARQRALDAFKNGNIRALVATDIAARGIDVDGVTHVVNFDLPNDPESYVHRIGRTARAGATGVAIAFCDLDEKSLLKDIEKTIRQSVPVFEDHPYHSVEIANDPGTTKRPQQKQRQGQGQRGRGGPQKPTDPRKGDTRKRSRRPSGRAA